MSAISMHLTDSGILPRRDRTPGFSEGASRIHREEEDIARSLIEETSLGSAWVHSICAASEIMNEAQLENWDGYGGQPADFDSYLYTLQLIDGLPPGYPPANISATPDGELALQWTNGKNDIFSISVAPDGALTFAGQFGKSTLFGTEAFTGEEISQTIRLGLSRLFPQAENNNSDRQRSSR